MTHSSSDYTPDSYADALDDPPTHADDKAAETALDELHAEQDTADDQPDDDSETCHAELVDGSYTYCGCEDCDERATRDGEDGDR
jgi:hypothetical protein